MSMLAATRICTTASLAIALSWACSETNGPRSLTRQQVEYLRSRLLVEPWGDSLRWDAGRKQGIAAALQELKAGRAMWYFDVHDGLVENVESICGLAVLPRGRSCLRDESKSARSCAHDSTIAAELLRTGLGGYSMSRWRSEIEWPDRAFEAGAAKGAIEVLWPNRSEVRGSPLQGLTLVERASQHSETPVIALATANCADSLRPEYILWSRVQAAESIAAVAGDSAAGLAFIKIVMKPEYWQLAGPVSYLAADLRSGVVLNQVDRH